jgi:hypothetical protein
LPLISITKWRARQDKNVGHVVDVDFVVLNRQSTCITIDEENREMLEMVVFQIGKGQRVAHQP